MHKNIPKYSILALAAVLAGGLNAANDSNQGQNRSASDQQQQTQKNAQSSAGQQGKGQPAGKAANKPMSDQDIQSAVQKKLGRLDGIDASKIKTEINDHTVTLTGTVDSLIETERIVEAVSAIRGVHGVISKFTISAEPRSDSEIQADVQAALKFDPATSAKPIQVAVTNGEVRLTGQADSSPQKQLAGWVAANVRGVKKINNELTLASSTRSDSDIKQALEKRLRSEPLVSDNISVKVNNGRVELSGEVASALEKQWAIDDARGLNPTGVDAANLRVNSESRGSGSSSKTTRTDEQIKDAIVQAYANDARVHAYNPDVKVNHGQVTLTGTVDNLKSRQSAEQIAQNTAGVKQVTNNLSIRGENISDDQVAQNLREALQRSVLVDADNIKVSAAQGRVTLTGNVGTNFERWASADVAARTRGVTEVQNELTTADQPLAGASTDYYFYPWHSSYWPWTYTPSSEKKTDPELQAAVRDQLMWSPFTDAEDIQISVKDGVVTLTGQVDNQMEKRAAVDNSYEAGATRVENRLSVLEPTGR